MSNDGNKIKVSASPCLSEQEMMDYIHDRLSPEQRNRVEKHLLECDLCADAMEGLGIMKSAWLPGDIDKWIDETVIAAPVAEKGKIMSFRFNYRVAAAIALLLVGGGVLYFTMFKSSDKEKTITQIIKPVVNPDSVKGNQQVDEKAKTAGQSEVNVDAEKEMKAQTSAARKPEKKAIASKATVTDTVTISANANSPAATTITMEELKMAPVTKKPDNSLAAIQKADSFILSMAATDDYAANKNSSMERIAPRKQMPSYRGKSTASGRSQSKSDQASEPDSPQATTQRYTMHAETNAGAILTEAMQAYEQKDFNEAAKKFDSYFTTHAYNEKATFYAAVSNLKINNAAIALSQFEQVLKNDHSEFTDAARWFKALALVKLNRMDEAKSLLKEIKESNSKYNNDAGTMLDGL